MAATAPEAAVSDEQWFALDSDAVAAKLGVDPHAGLSPDEASKRLEQYGPNAFVAAETEPRWRAFVRQYRDPMQIVLLAAGVASLYPLKQLGTGILLILLTLFNAVLAGERVPARLGLGCGELVRAEPPGPSSRLSRAQAALRVCPFGAEDLVGAERVPRKLTGRRRPSRSRSIRHPGSHVDCRCIVTAAPRRSASPGQ